MKTFINLNNLPKHISIIMDGNGGWANQKGISRIFGHHHSLKSTESIINGCVKLKIPYLTLYAFSKENWKRSEMEVKYIIKLIVRTIKNNLKNFINNNIKLTIIGDIKNFSIEYQNEINFAINISKNNNKLNLIILINYSGRWEITEAIKLICNDIKNNILNLNNINNKTFLKYLFTNKIPNPDLLIRAGGEARVSNFFLWQIAYTEIFITKVSWPNFRKKDFYKAILNFQKRKRKFGLVKKESVS